MGNGGGLKFHWKGTVSTGSAFDYSFSKDHAEPKLHISFFSTELATAKPSTILLKWGFFCCLHFTSRKITFSIENIRTSSLKFATPFRNLTSSASVFAVVESYG
jgi:hypothetical protein